MHIQSKFIELKYSKKIWAIGSIHSHLDSFNSIKEHIEKHFIYGDKLVFLGNIIGFGKNYSLELAPKSHISVHGLNNYNKSKKYISRGFKESYVKKFNFIRPNLKLGEALIHHPNLVHGGSINYGNGTRISLEIRIFDKKKFNIKRTFDNSIW